MERHFEGKQEAKSYKLYRPTTGQNVTDKIMNYVREKNEGPLKLLVDVGCGSGQHTLAFTSYFDKVLGTDISPNMIAEIATDPTLPSNVSFAVSPAEELPVPDSSVDVVTGAQCFHWFDHEKFHIEMNRVLKPNGVVAIIGHELEFLSDPNDEKKSEELSNATIRFFVQLLPYLQNAASPILNRYSNLSFPYADVVREVEVRSESPITLADYIGLMGTYSQFQSWKRQHPESALAAQENLIKDICQVIEVKEGTPLEDIQTTLRLENFLLLGRKK
ncbi:hypothetical protein CHUAL_002430 [Chamberlinius hualienensis]